MRMTDRCHQTRRTWVVACEGLPTTHHEAEGEANDEADELRDRGRSPVVYPIETEEA